LWHAKAGGLSVFGDDFMGEIDIRVDTLKKKEPLRLWMEFLPRRSQRFQDLQGRGEVQIEITWIDGRHLKNKILGITLHQARGLTASDWSFTGRNLSDPYAIFSYGKETCRSPTVEQNLNPKWESYHIMPYQSLHSLELSVMDYDQGPNTVQGFLGDDFLGEVRIPTSDIQEGDTIRAWYQLHSKRRHAIRDDEVAADLGEVEMSLTCFEGKHFVDTKLRVTIVRARNLRALDYMSSSSDPYCTVVHGKQTTTTAIVMRSLNPEWGETFLFDYQMTNPLRVKVIEHDDNIFGMHDFAGQVLIPVNQLELHTPVTKWYTLCDQHDCECTKPYGEIEVVVEWIDGTMFKNSQLDVEVVQARGLRAMDMDGLSDPYAVIRLGRQERQTTSMKCTLSPVWNHLAKLDFEPLQKLVVELFDHDDFSFDGDDFMGKVEIPISRLVKGEEQNGWYPLRDDRGREVEDYGEVELRLLWHSASAVECMMSREMNAAAARNRSNSRADLRAGVLPPISVSRPSSRRPSRAEPS